MFQRAKKFCENHGHLRHNTCLHLVIYNDCLAAPLRAFLNSIPTGVAAEMAKMVNDDGKIPFDLIDRTLIATEKEQIHNLLIPLMLSQVKGINEPVNFDNIQAQYNLKAGSLSYGKFFIACQAMNAVRKKIRTSSTHPQHTPLTPLKKVALDLTIKNMRLSKAKKYNKALFLSKRNKYTTAEVKPDGFAINVELSPGNHQQRLKISNVKSNIGNCEEMAFSTLYKINELYAFFAPFKAFPYYLSPGDHSFLILASHPTQINPDDIVCDPWKGDVFFFHELHEKMGGYRCIYTNARYFNIITAFNSNYHKISHAVIPAFNTITFDLTHANVVTKFIQDLAAQDAFTPQEYLIFFRIVRPALEEAMSRNWVIASELRSLQRPAQTLKLVFVTEHGLDLLKCGKVRITAVEQKQQKKIPLILRGLFAPVGSHLHFPPTPNKVAPSA